MKAVVFDTYGEPEVLYVGTVPDPVAGAGEVRVRVQACGVNNVDIQFRRGERGRVRLPHVLGAEIAGVVDQVGLEVSSRWMGQRVAVLPYTSCHQCAWCRRGQEQLCLQRNTIGRGRFGGYAEYVVVPVANLVEVPDSLPLVDAAATVLSGLAAWHVLVSKVSIKPGQRILVVAAGGGVGTWAVQIAKWAGLHVIATVGAREKMARVQALGAEAIVHRGAPAWGDHVRALTDGQGVDVVFDTAGAATWDESWRALSRGGTVALCGATGGGLVGLDLLTVFREEYHIVGVTGGTYGELQQLMRAVAGGLLKPVIDQTAPLAAAREMHQRLESRRVVGKVILTA